MSCPDWTRLAALREGAEAEPAGWTEAMAHFDATIKGERTQIWELLLGGYGRCEFARFPLSEDGQDVSQILAMEDYDFPRLEAVPGLGER